MATKTKAQLETELYRLQEELKATKAKLSAIDHRIIRAGRWDNTGYIAVPLMQEERRIIDDSDFAARRCCELCGEGEVVSRNEETGYTTYDLIAEWGYTQIFPQFDALLIRYSYQQQNGTIVENVWGLRKVRS